jgi:hypothetical protein
MTYHLFLMKKPNDTSPIPVYRLPQHTKDDRDATFR